MTIPHPGLYDVARIQHAERIRDAERFRRAKCARTGTARNAAARTERRFSFVRRSAPARAEA